MSEPDTSQDQELIELLEAVANQDVSADQQERLAARSVGSDTSCGK